MAGTPGVRLPGVLPPQFGARSCGGIDRDIVITSRPHHHTTFVAFCVKSQRLMMDVERDAGGGTGSARRRRERRLRSLLRHERMSVAMALAESTHHSAQRQKTARARGEARVVLHGHVPEAPFLHGSRPPCLGEPRGPQDQDQLRSME